MLDLERFKQFVFPSSDNEMSKSARHCTLSSPPFWHAWVARFSTKIQ